MSDHDGHTQVVGYVHTREDDGRTCRANCPHPDHAGAARERHGYHWLGNSWRCLSCDVEIRNRECPYNEALAAPGAAASAQRDGLTETIDHRDEVNPSSRRPMVCGEPAADRLMRSLDYRLHPDARELTADEVAVVLHALADHSALMAALAYARDYPAGSGAEDPLWPDATSLGRWLHDTADQLEGLKR